MGSNTAAAGRSPAQAEASRVNGARALGPVTAVGKVSSASNGIVHAFAANAALMSGESLDEYRLTVQAWFESFRPANMAEAKVVARLADLDFRQQRISRAEHRLLEEAIDAKVSQSDAYVALMAARNALEGIRGLAVLAETAPANVTDERVAQILPGMSRIAQLVSAVDLPVAVTAPLGYALELFVLDTVIIATPGAFQNVARAARGIEAALVTRVAELESAVEQQRERIAEVTLCPTGEEAKILDRHRSRLAREVERTAKTLRTVRELSAMVSGDAPGSSVEFVLEVRAIGRGGGR
jgi:hypothetical protein